MKIRVLLIFFCCFISVLKGQNLPQFKKDIDTLCSETMYGRGYINNGHIKSAEYIAERFKNIGLKPLKKGYKQSFPLPVNTFPGKIELVTNGQKLTLGADYIMHPYSCSKKATLNCVRLKDKDLSSSKKFEKFIRKKVTNQIAIVFDQVQYTKIRSKYESHLEYFYRAGAHIQLQTTPLVGFMAQAQFPLPVILAKKSLEENFKDEITLDIEAQFEKDLKSFNVVGYLPGTTRPDSAILIGAHHDHLGGMGDIYFPGANDNASGVAMLLSLAEYFADSTHRPKYSIIFAAFGGEEVALVGSKFYCGNPLFSMKKTRFMVSLDLFGAGSKGITVVNAPKFEKDFEQLKKLNNEKNYLGEVKPRKPAANSDHHYFDVKGVPNFFIYTTGNLKAYHDTKDIPSVIEYEYYDKVFGLMKDFFVWKANN